MALALGSTQPPTEMSTRSISWGKGGRCVRLTTLPSFYAVVMKSGNFNLLEPSGSLQVWNGTVLSDYPIDKLPKRYPMRQILPICIQISCVRLIMGWTVRGSNLGGDEVFRTRPDRPWGPPNLLYNGYRVSPGVKSGQVVTLTPHPLIVPWSRKSRAIPLLPLWAVGLYRASVPVQGCTLPYFLRYVY